MRALATAPDQEPTLPDAGLLWWKAQLLQRWEAEREASAPIDTMQRVEVGAGLAGLVALVYWFWPAVTQWLSNANPASLASIGSLAPAAQGVISIVTVGALLLALMMAIALHTLLAEE